MRDAHLIAVVAALTNIIGRFESTNNELVRFDKPSNEGGYSPVMLVFRSLGTGAPDPC